MVRCNCPAHIGDKLWWIWILARAAGFAPEIALLKLWRSSAWEDPDRAGLQAADVPSEASADGTSDTTLIAVLAVDSANLAAGTAPFAFNHLSRREHRLAQLCKSSGSVRPKRSAAAPMSDLRPLTSAVPGREIRPARCGRPTGLRERPQTRTYRPQMVSEMLNLWPTNRFFRPPYTGRSTTTVVPWPGSDRNVNVPPRS